MAWCLPDTPLAQQKIVLWGTCRHTKRSVEASILQVIERSLWIWFTDGAGLRLKPTFTWFTRLHRPRAPGDCGLCHEDSFP